MWALDTITLRPEVLIYVVNLAVVASLVCGLSLLAVWVCRNRSAPFRYNILASGLAFTLLCPAAAWFGQHHGPGLIEVRVAGQPPSAGDVVIQPLKSVLTAHETSTTDETRATHEPTVQPAKYLSPEPLVLGLPAEPEILSNEPSAEPSAAGYSLRPVFHSDQTGSPAVAPLGTLGNAGRTTAPSRAEDNRFAPAWWQLAGTLVVYAWVLGVGIGTFRLARGYRSVVRLRRSLKPVLGARLTVIAREAAGALRLGKSPPILTSGRIPVPISLGVWSPVIILPENMAREMEKTQLTAVLLHEMAHIARRDHLTGLAQRLALILFWWNSLVRRLSRRISELREELCDNHVLQVQGGGAPLAGVLIEIADRAAVGPRLPAAVGMNGPELDGLGKRISRLVNKEPNMATRMNRVGSAAVFLCGLTVLLGIACAGSLRAFEQDAGQAGPAQQSEKGVGGDEAASSGFLEALDEDGEARSVVPNASPRKRQSSKHRSKSRLSTKAELKDVYQSDFRGSRFDRRMLMPFGFETLWGLQLLRPEPGGLRVVIPQIQGLAKPLIGVFPLLTIRRDFEITADFELLAAEAPEGDGVAGASLYVLAKKTLNSAVVRRGVDFRGKQVYLVSCWYRDDGEARQEKLCFPAAERAGKLRLARNGTTLQFLVAGEDDREFHKLHELEFGAEDIGFVRLETSSEYSPIGVEVLWKDLTIRAEELIPTEVPIFHTSMFDGLGSTPRTYVESTESVAQRAGIQAFEPFDGQLALDWKPVRPDPTHVSLTKNPGKLTITTQYGGIWRGVGPSAKNFYLIRNPMAEDGDFVLTTLIESFRPTMKWQQAGLLVYDDDDNYVKCEMESGEGNPRFAFLLESDGEVESNVDETGAEAEKVWIRIIKRGKSYERAYSLDGRRFVSAGEADWGDGSPEWIGLFAKNGPSQAAEIDAVFDFFEVRSLTPTEKAHQSVSVSDTAPPNTKDQATLRFNFRNQRWEDVLTWYAEQAGLSLEMNATPSGTFNYTDSRQYTLVQAMDLLNEALLAKNVKLIRRDGMLVVYDESKGLVERILE